MKPFLLFILTSIFSCFNLLAQTDFVRILPDYREPQAQEDIDGLPDYREPQAQEEVADNQELDLRNYFEVEASDELQGLENDPDEPFVETKDEAVFEQTVLADVIGYRELPTYTVDDFEETPVFHDFLGSVDIEAIEVEREPIAENEIELLEMSSNLEVEAFDIAALEERAFYSIFAPPCGSPSVGIYCDDVVIPDNTCLYEFPIKNNQPYLIQIQRDKSVHLLSEAHFGINMGELEMLKWRRNRKNAGYEDMEFSFDTFELKPVTVKVYDKWGEIVEVHKTNTGETVQLNTSDYWWSLYWVSFYFEGDDCLLLKQLYIEK